MNDKKETQCYFITYNVILTYTVVTLIVIHFFKCTAIDLCISHHIHVATASIYTRNCMTAADWLPAVHVSLYFQTCIFIFPDEDILVI